MKRPPWQSLTMLAKAISAISGEDIDCIFKNAYAVSKAKKISMRRAMESLEVKEKQDAS